MDDIYFSLDRQEYLNNDLKKITPYLYTDLEIPLYFYRDDNLQRFDVFGSIFFFLTLSHEADLECDKHARVKVNKFKFDPEVPIVDIYINYLWQLIYIEWPTLERRILSSYKFDISHDVDQPFYDYKMSILKFVRFFIGDLFKRKCLYLALDRFIRYFGSKFAPAIFDRYFSVFDYLLNYYEKEGIRATFYFIAIKRVGKYECDYDIENRHIKRLLFKIHSNGHQVGLHGSYNSYSNIDLLKEEFDKLKKVCSEIGINQQSWGVRQHYLRFGKDTSRIQNEIGFQFDSTIGFAETSGFRSGTSFPYRIFNLDTRKVLDIVEKPLIVMEGTYLTRVYNNHNVNFLDIIKKNKLLIKKYGGVFSLLWHNNLLVDKLHKKVFEDTIRELKK